MRAAAIFNPSMPIDLWRSGPQIGYATKAAIMVPIEATTKANKSGPHLCLHSFIFTPNKRSGVASCIHNSCSAFVAGDPPIRFKKSEISML